MSAQHDRSMFTEIEQNFEEQLAQVSDKEFKKAEVVFGRLSYQEFPTPKDDLDKVCELLPNLNRSKVENCRVKVKEGVCDCGRKMNLYDIVAKAVSTGTHSRSFLEHIFNGEAGKLAVSTAKATEEQRSELPDNAIYVEDSAPIPCTNCGKNHELVLLTDTVLHYWVF